MLIDGVRMNSCLSLAVARDGQQIVTVEGLAQDGKLHPMQAAFVTHDGFQCGYCTPGMMMSALDLIEHHDEVLTPEVVRAEMEGNLCRCTGYHNIVNAVVQASRVMKGG